MEENITIDTFIKSLKISKHIEFENLRFEIIKRKKDLEIDYKNLSYALANNLIVINEINDSGSVPQLLCKNNSNSYILILAGEEIVGAKQNRIVNASLILSPKKEIYIPVSCVEEGRWAFKSRNFTKGTNAYPDLKRKLYEDVNRSRDVGVGHQSNQGRIWGDIKSKEAQFNKFSNTGAMHELYEESDQLNHFIAKNNDMDGSGMVTFINGSVASFDILPSKKFFNEVFSELVKSAHQQSRLYKNSSKTYSFYFSTTMFLNKLKKSYYKTFEGVDLGENNSIKSNSIGGDFLSYDKDIIHFYTFPRGIN